MAFGKTHPFPPVPHLLPHMAPRILAFNYFSYIWSHSLVLTTTQIRGCGVFTSKRTPQMFTPSHCHLVVGDLDTVRLWTTRFGIRLRGTRVWTWGCKVMMLTINTQANASMNHWRQVGVFPNCATLRTIQTHTSHQQRRSKTWTSPPNDRFFCRKL